MSDIQVSLFALGVLLLLLFLRVPIAVALGLVSFTGISVVMNFKSALGVLTAIPHEVVANWTLTSVPMFLLMGYICHHAKLTHGLFEAARLWLSPLPGGLAVATIGAGAGFSAVTGSSVACAAAIGRIAIPEMVRSGYDKRLAGGACAAAGTIGSMIPPSILLLLYGIFVEAPIGPLFLAGFLPGILTALMYCVAIFLYVKWKPTAAPKTGVDASWAERILVLRKTAPTLLLVFGVFGGLLTGIFTPTEAGAVGAALALVIATGMRTLTWETLKLSLSETLNSTAAIFIIAIGAHLLTRFLALAGFTDFLAGFVEDAGLNPMMLMLLVCLAYFLLGMFLDPLGIMLLTLPIFMPLVEGAGINLIWFGILIVKLLEIGLITPPVGLNVFVIKGVVGNLISTDALFRGIAIFLAADVVTLTLLIAFPEISLFLPRLLGN